MANIGVALKQEITRLARKESRQQVDSTRKASTQQRREIAALKKRIGQLEREVKAMTRKAARATSVGAAVEPDAAAPRTRFSAKGLQALRARLDLSAADLGRLLGVSAQSVYNWEHDKARPKPAQLERLAAVRVLGKRKLAEALQATT